MSDHQPNQSPDRISGISLLLHAVILLMLIYVTLPAIAYLDERVLDTDFLYSHTPKWAVGPIKAAYWPLAELLKLFF